LADGATEPRDAGRTPGAGGAESSRVKLRTWTCRPVARHPDGRPALFLAFEVRAPSLAEATARAWRAAAHLTRSDGRTVDRIEISPRD